MGFSKRGSHLLLLIICFIFTFYGLFVFKDRNDVGQQVMLQNNCDLRCAFKSSVSTDIEIKDLGNLAALSQSIMSSLEILRISNRSSTILSLHSLVDHQMSVLDHLLGIDNWRLKISRNLSRKIKTKIGQLQSPKDCSSAPRLYCDIRNNAGLASGAHDLLWCALNAYLNSSMLVVISEHWHYTAKGWDKLFQPVSATCQNKTERVPKTSWPGRCDDEHRHNLTTLPPDFADELLLLGPNPLPWWYGQLLGNLLKPSKNIEERVTKNMEKLGFASPIVGLHIRRTDKIGREGAYHSADEYMAPVVHYYDTLQLGGKDLKDRKVFVATDDPTALKELREQYSGYTFLYNARSAQTAEKLSTRYKQESMEDAVVDLFMISKVDYLVCSFSSGYSRLAYEMMLFNKPEALDNVYSVDTEYYYAGASNPPRITVFAHPAAEDDELDLSIGDVLVQPYFTSLQDDATKGKVFNGYSRGQNDRTGKTGNYPLYKTKPVFHVFD